jgi:5'(3')-deoxyribonucleotidase
MTGPSEPDPEDSAFLAGNRVRVLFDVDSVIANLVQVFVSAIEAAGIRVLPKGWLPRQFDIAAELGFTKNEEKRMYDMLQLPGVANTVLPYAGAIAGVKRVARIADAFFVTTPLRGSPTWVYDRNSWLVRHFGEELGSKWVYTEHKYAVFGELLVDDKPENCMKFEKAWPGSIGLRWLPQGQPVVDGLYNVNSWDMVYHWVEQYTRQKAIWRRQ